MRITPESSLSPAGAPPAATPATAPSGPDPQRGRSATVALPPVPARPAANPALSEALLARLGDSLKRAESHLLAVQKADGRWDTPFVAGSYHMALGVLALAAVGDPAILTQGESVIARFARDQAADGGFSITAGEPSNRAATRLVVLTIKQLVRRLPSLADAAKPVLEKARAFLKRDGAQSSDALHGLIVDLMVATLEPNPGTIVVDMGMLKEIAKRHFTGSLSNLVRLYAPAMLLIAINQGLLGGFGIGTGYLAAQIREFQDSEGSWGWTDLGTALSMIALARAGEEYASSRALQKGVGFLHQLRAIDEAAWTHGDAWDTGIVSLALATLSPQGAAAAKRGTDAVVTHQLEDGRFSFSLAGFLGDNDTTSTILRSLCARHGISTDPAEREKLAHHIAATARGLLAYQQQSGGWGAFNKTAYTTPGPNGPRNVTESTFDDAASPDLTARVTRSLKAVRDSGILGARERQEVEEAMQRSASYLAQAADGRGRWWSRWTNGKLSGFSFIVPVLRQLGVAPDAQVFAKTRGFVLSQQNRDGGWGETIAADRGESGRGPSSVVHTAGAIVALIGTMKDSEARDPVLLKALESGVAFLLSAEREGVFQNRRALYTAITGVDYYDADASTTCFAAGALALYRDFTSKGPEKAITESLL